MSDTNSNETFLSYILYLLKLFFDFGFIILPSTGFIAQYLKIKSIKNSAGFSKFISFALMMAYIFRIYFWLGKKFEVTLVYQSIFGIIIQLILLELCVKYMKKENYNSDNNEFNSNNNINTNSEINFLKFFSYKNFWNWNLFLDYLNVVFFIIIVLGVLTHILEENKIIYFEVLGSISAICESLIGIPQIIENYRYKSTKTLSNILILTWIMGDSIKLAYFLLTDTPIQMIICSITQLSEDIIIIGQIFQYKE